MANGIVFDFDDQKQVNAFVVKSLERLELVTQGLPEMKIEHAVMKQEIADIRDDMKDDKFWGNVKTAIGPVMVVLHSIARNIGFKI